MNRLPPAPLLLALLVLPVALARTPSQDATAAPPELSADKLFDPNHLVDVRIEIEPKRWQQLCGQSRSLVRALKGGPPAKTPFEYFPADVVIDGVRIPNVGVRKKGFLGSLDGTRPSLKIKFAEYVQQSPLGAIDRLTLNNNKQDTSQLSQYLGYKLFNEAGVVASRCNFARVTVNDELLGIYSHVESVKPWMLERGYGQGNSGGMLFEGTIADVTTESVERFEAKTKNGKLVQLREIAELLEQDELDLDALAERIELKSFLKFWAVESLIGFWDGYTHNQNNFFVYQNPSDGKHYFMPWGLDSAFTYFLPPPIDWIRNRSFHSQSVLANRLYRHPVARKMYRETLDELLAEHWNEEQMLADIDRVELLLKDHLHPSQRGFRRSANSVRKFVKGRRDVIQKELKRWPIPLNTSYRQPVATKEIGKGSLSFSTQWSDRRPGSPHTRGKVDIKLTLDGDAVRFREVGATTFRENNELKMVVSGKTEPRGGWVTLEMTLVGDGLEPSEKPRFVNGVLFKGSSLALIASLVLKGPTGLNLLDGQVTLDQGATEPDATVAGKLEFAVVKLIGGKSKRLAWNPE